MHSWIAAVVLAALTASALPDAGPPVWLGFSATAKATPTLAAFAHGPLEVYPSPDDAGEPTLVVEPLTILGTITVLAAVAPPQDGWVEVILPVRPNGSTGWVQVDQVSLYVVDGEIVVDLSDRILTYTVDGVEVVRTEVGIGSVHNETPTGHFFVTDNVRVGGSNGPWGPYALGLSARSDTIPEFNGGAGIIGIPGTNNPASIGDDIALGCVRLPNDVISTLPELVPIGTRVTIQE
jgi:lipoprotein-anchoring transpeptidase ErfK/SrfK